MAHMLNGGPGADCPARAFQPCVEMMLSRLTEVELEQVILSLGAGYIGGKEEIDALSYRDVFSIDEEGRSVIKIPAHLHQVLLGPRIKAFMARPAVDRTSADDHKLGLLSIAKINVWKKEGDLSWTRSCDDQRNKRENQFKNSKGLDAVRTDQ